MSTSLLQRPIAKKAVAVAAASLAIGFSFLTATNPAGADPKQLLPQLSAAGSDTTQDIDNAFAGGLCSSSTAGVCNTFTNFTPLQSSSASGFKQLTSWDATGTACITPKPDGKAIKRPNGSSDGRAALSRAIEGTNYPNAGLDLGCGVKSPAGSIDFARSSDGPSGTGTDLTYIPFAVDGLGFGFAVESGVTPVSSLTKAQLVTIFTTAGPTNIGGVDIYACGIQTSSGTFKSWNSKLGMTTGQEATGTAACNAAGTGNRVQENDGNGLKAKLDALVTANPAQSVQAVVGFSAANFIAQTNGVVSSQLPSPAGTVDLGSISDFGGIPYTGSVASPPIAASVPYYSNVTTGFGRRVYHVVPSSKIGGLPAANQDFKSMFVGATSSVCSASAQATVTTFGFLSQSAAVPAGAAGTCGSTTDQGPLVNNPTS